MPEAGTLYERILVQRTLAPVARVNGTFNGLTVDRAAGNGFDGAMATINTGTITDGTHTFTVQDSPDGSVWTNVAAGLLQGGARGVSPALLAADSNALVEIGYSGAQRYLRVTVVVTGATTGGIYSASIVLGFPRYRPVVHP
jgi:hypothetical protein